MGALEPTYVVLDVQAALPVAEQKADEETEKSMRLAGCYCLIGLLFSPSSLRRASTETRMHAVTHIHAPGHTHQTHLPPAHAFLILLPLLMAGAFCSLLFPFSLSLSAPPFPFSISSFFLCTCSWLLLSAPPFPPTVPLPLAQPLPPSPCLTRSLSLSLFSVCRARGHYLSHSGHVRWNGGERSEQKHRAVGGSLPACSKPTTPSSKAPSKEKISPCRHPCLLFSSWLRLCYI